MYTAFAPAILARALREAAAAVSIKKRTWHRPMVGFSGFVTSLADIPDLPEGLAGTALVTTSAAMLDAQLSERVRGLDSYFSSADSGVGILTTTEQRIDFLSSAGVVHLRHQQGHHRLVLLDKYVRVYELERHLPATSKQPPGIPRNYRLPVACVDISGGLLWLVGTGPLDKKPTATSDLRLYARAQELRGEALAQRPSARWRSILVPDIVVRDTLELDWLSGATLSIGNEAPVLTGVFQTLHLWCATGGLEPINAPKSPWGEQGATLAFDGPTLMFKTNTTGHIVWLAHVSVKDWAVHSN